MAQDGIFLVKSLWFNLKLLDKGITVEDVPQIFQLLLPEVILLKFDGNFLFHSIKENQLGDEGATAIANDLMDDKWTAGRWSMIPGTSTLVSVGGKAPCGAFVAKNRSREDEAPASSYPSHIDGANLETVAIPPPGDGNAAGHELVPPDRGFRTSLCYPFPLLLWAIIDTQRKRELPKFQSQSKRIPTWLVIPRFVRLARALGFHLNRRMRTFKAWLTVGLNNSP